MEISFLAHPFVNLTVRIFNGRLKVFEKLPDSVRLALGSERYYWPNVHLAFVVIVYDFSYGCTSTSTSYGDSQ